MVTTTVPERLSETLTTRLHGEGFGPFLGAPCEMLDPLYKRLLTRCGMMAVTREDNAVGVAVGAALSGRSPVVLMQDTGLDQCANAITSLVSPYGFPMLFVVGMSGIGPHPNDQASKGLLLAAGIPAAYLAWDNLDAQVAWSGRLVVARRMPAALLIRPGTFE